MRMWLNPAHGPLLLGLAERTGAELVWASTWSGSAANAMVGRALGLPELASISYVPGAALGDGHWKFPAVGRFAGTRPLVWFDDDFDLYPTARDAFVARRSGPVKLVPVDPHVGITEGQVAEVERWLRVVGAGWPEWRSTPHSDAVHARAGRRRRWFGALELTRALLRGGSSGF